MRRFLLFLFALVALDAAGFAPFFVAEALAASTFRKAGKVRMGPCTSSGTVAATLEGGDRGVYLFIAANERTCICLGASTCADDAASGSICLPAGAGLEIRNPAAGPVACWSAGGSGLAELNQVVGN